jgi:hypothetical protein
MLETISISVMGSAKWNKKINQVDGRVEDCDPFDAGCGMPFVLAFNIAVDEIGCVGEG